MPETTVDTVNVGRSADTLSITKVHTETYYGAVKQNLQPYQVGAHSRRRILDKEQALEIIKLLSALESWSFSFREKLPTYLIDQIAASIEVLEKEVLK